MGTKGFWGNNEHFDVIAGQGWNPAPTVCASCGFDMRDVLEAAPYARILLEWFYCGRGGGTPPLLFVQAVVLIYGASWRPPPTDIYILQQKEKEVLYSTSVIQNLQFDF